MVYIVILSLMTAEGDAQAYFGHFAVNPFGMGLFAMFGFRIRLSSVSMFNLPFCPFDCHQ